MFPACAGMNRDISLDAFFAFYVPRVRGDEPKEAVGIERELACSPRARG